jgi:hypothetical protein
MEHGVFDKGKIGFVAYPFSVIEYFNDLPRQYQLCVSVPLG